MRRLGTYLFSLTAVVALPWWLGPYEPADLTAAFDSDRLGPGVQAYLETTEAGYDDITPGTEKRVIWAGQPEMRTPVSVVYLHGYSATSEEIRPVPDRIAQALGANLVYTRLAGHGRPGPALAEATVSDWMHDTAEALAVARAVGDRVVVIATSTGATLAAAAAVDPELSADVAAMVLVSPNFGINNSLAPLLTWPGARYWLPPLAGRERVIAPRSEAQETFWTIRYPSVAVMPLAALVEQAAALDLSKTDIPALFWYSEDDKVVRPDITTRKAAEWGGPVKVRLVTMGPGDDEYAHVVAGDAMSPGQTGTAVKEMLEWLKIALN